jgi:hypothetical protein
MSSPDRTTLHFAPGGHVTRVEPGPILIDTNSRTAKDVFAPGPGWTLMAGENAPATTWTGITRTADRVAVMVSLGIHPDGSRTATLAPIPPEQLGDRRMRALELWLRALGEDIRAHTEHLLAGAHEALDEDRNSTAEEDAALVARIKGAARHIQERSHAPALLRHGGAAADLLGELSVGGTPELPFQRPMAALVAQGAGLDLTAVNGALADLGLSVSTVPKGRSVVDHLEETRMHCAAVVLGRHEDVPEGGLDVWLERFLGPMLRIEIADLKPARFRTTEAGRLQLDADLTPDQVLQALRTHAADRGFSFG